MLVALDMLEPNDEAVALLLAAILAPAQTLMAQLRAATEML